MSEIVVGPILHHVTETSATVFIETARAAQVEILGRGTSTFEVGGHHYALVIIEDLQPGTSVIYEVRLDGAVCKPLPGSAFPPGSPDDRCRISIVAGGHGRS